MQIIIISSKSTQHIHLSLRHITAMISLLIMAALLLVMTSTVDDVLPSSAASNNHNIRGQSLSTAHIAAPADLINSNEYYARRLGLLQAESIRLKAIAEKIAEVSGIELSAFNLTQQPAQGGLAQQGEIITADSLDAEIELLSQTFSQQQQQLSLLQRVHITSESITSAIPQGSPIDGGWLSSAYGYRIDPFNGKKTFHKGIDLAGKTNSEIVAVATGIVAWTGTRNGYGQMIDIDHGNGYITRYAHTKKVVVNVGQRVEKGHVIAIMGSTGRSTGPHVHFEVLRDGKTINPYNFIKG